MIHYRLNKLHPTALYLSEEWWFKNSILEDLPPLPRDVRQKGYSRIRITLPDQTKPRQGWQFIKKTRFGSVSLLNEIGQPQNVDLRNLTRGSPDYEKWLEFHHLIYSEAHHDNPVAILSLTDIERAFAGTDLLNDCMIALYRNGHVSGVTSLRKGEGNTIELGWTGVSKPSGPTDMQALLLAAL